MKKMLYGKDAAPVLAGMNYRDGEKTCGQCAFFVGCDISGIYNALNAHCDLNAVKIEVQPTGCCDFFKKNVIK